MLIGHKKEEGRVSTVILHFIRKSPTLRKTRLTAALSKKCQSASQDSNPACLDRLPLLYQLCHQHCQPNLFSNIDFFLFQDIRLRLESNLWSNRIEKMDRWIESSVTFLDQNSFHCFIEFASLRRNNGTELRLCSRRFKPKRWEFLNST